jgi:glycosyltransferase involved in cell wall biosynthesis
VWIDAAEDRALVGWLHWPDDASRHALEATVNGEPAELTVAVAGRPDVPSVIGVRNSVHAIRIAIDVDALSLGEPVDIALRSGDVSLVVWKGTANQLVAGMLARSWPLGAPPVVTSAVLGRLARPTVAPGLADGAVRQGAREPAPPALFTDGAFDIGPRHDLPVSRFQAHCWVRHVRDHPGFRTDRHYTASTKASTVEFLVWSLRSFAQSYPLAPLPLGDSDLALLNHEVPATGLPKGRAGGVVGSSLTLTAAQCEFVSAMAGRVEAADDDELADWLLAWVGSWGWGHKGLRLMTAPQVRFLREGATDAFAAGTIGAASYFNRYVRARLRERTSLREAYPELHLPHVRQALMLELLASDLVDVGSEALIHDDFLTAVSDSDYLATVSQVLSPKSTSRPALATATVAEPAQDQPQVRVLGMLDSKSGLGQNARNSVAAFRSAGLGTAVYSIAINDRTVVSPSPNALRLAPAAVNLWHLNPDNLPEAVCTIDPSLYNSSYNVGFFAWELDRQPRAHMLAIDWVDEIWVPSEYCAASFRTVTDKPVTVMPHAIEVPDDLEPFARDRLGVAPDDFLVHCSFDMHSWPQRKNPIGTIRAFQLAFDDERARLLLKIRNGANIGIVDSDRDQIGEAVLELAEADDRILVDVLERGYSETLGLVATSDCHLSLHRSEGFGYTLAESLALGVTLVCSDYGGSRDFCSDENCWLVPVEERLLAEGEYYLAPPGASWGEPDVATAASLLRQVRAGGPEVAARVASGRRDSDRFSVATMGTLYAQRVNEILT